MFKSHQPSSGPGPAQLSVHSRVRVQLPDGAQLTGVIFEDFADLFPADGTEVSVKVGDNHRVRLRRWGIKADDGTLVFADDADLTALDSAAPTESK